MTKEFYGKKQESILKDFEKRYGDAEGYLVRRFDETTAGKIHDDAVERIKRLVPRLPDVGGESNQFIKVILLNAWYIPFFQAARGRGMSAEEYVRMITEALHGAFTRYPRWIRRIGGRLVLSGLFVRRMKRHAASSRERKYPKDWVYSVSTDTGDPGVLFRVEYSQCAACMLLEDFDAEELMPYCNVADFLMARALGFGFENPEVLGRGDGTCVGLFRKDGRCEIPDYLRFAFEGLEF
jgi:hypothetical protein